MTAGKFIQDLIHRHADLLLDYLECFLMGFPNKFCIRPDETSRVGYKVRDHLYCR